MIVDASVAFKWLVNEPDSSLAIRWIGLGDLHAPVLLHVEVANALWKQVRRGELPGDDETLAMLSAVGELLTFVDERFAISRALALAIELDHPVYDCMYLALAEGRGEKLLTADHRFLRKVRNSPYAALAIGIADEVASPGVNAPSRPGPP